MSRLAYFTRETLISLRRNLLMTFAGVMTVSVSLFLFGGILFILWDEAEGDREMRAFLALAGTTTMRKGEVLSLRWDRIHLEDSPYATLVRTKS